MSAFDHQKWQRGKISVIEASVIEDFVWRKEFIIHDFQILLSYSKPTLNIVVCFCISLDSINGQFSK